MRSAVITRTLATTALLIGSGLGIALPVAISVTLAGCSSMKPGSVAAVQPVTDRPRVGNAYLLRGFIGVFSTGIDHLGEEVNAMGVRGEVFQDDQWSDLADHIAERYRGHPNAEPLVLIGHSYGADDVIRMARKLDAANVPVDLLITLDPVTAPAVPKNVKLCIDLYQSNGAWDKLPWLRGTPLQPEAGSTGKLINWNIRTDRTDLLEPGVDHFNIEKKQKIHDEVLKQLLAICVPRQQWIMAQSGKAAPPTALATAMPTKPVIAAAKVGATPKPAMSASAPVATAVPRTAVRPASE